MTLTDLLWINFCFVIRFWQFFFIFNIALSASRNSWKLKFHLQFYQFILSLFLSCKPIKKNILCHPSPLISQTRYHPSHPVSQTSTHSARPFTTLLFSLVHGEKKILAKYFYCSIKNVRRSYDAYIIEAINHFYCDLRFIMFQFLLAPNAGSKKKNAMQRKENEKERVKQRRGKKWQSFLAATQLKQSMNEWHL